MVSWAHDPEKRWGALPLGESPKDLVSLPKPSQSSALSGTNRIADAGRDGSGSEAFSAPLSGAVLPPDPAAPDSVS